MFLGFEYRPTRSLSCRVYHKNIKNQKGEKMDSSAKLMKATGIIHIIHGSIMALFTIILLSYLSSINPAGGALVFLLTGGISFLYIYIGCILFNLQKPDKMRNLLITSIVFACIEIVYSMATAQIAGFFFIVEFIMVIICLANMDAYRKYFKKSNRRTSSKKSRR